MRCVVHWSVVVLCVIVDAAQARAQEPETRAEILRREREEKAQDLKRTAVLLHVKSSDQKRFVAVQLTEKKG